MPLTSCGEAKAALGAPAGTALCTGGGAILPSAVGGTTAAEEGGDKGGDGGTAVCGPARFGIAGTRGNENKSLTGGSTGAAAGDVPFSPSTKYGAAPGSTGVLPGD